MISIENLTKLTHFTFFLLSHRKQESLFNTSKNYRLIACYIDKVFDSQFVLFRT